MPSNIAKTRVRLRVRVRGEGEEGGGREVGEREARHVHAFEHRQHVLPPAHRLDRHAAVMVTRRGGEGRLVQNQGDERW